MSSMRCVTRKPPPMLMAEVSTAKAARKDEAELGRRPPPASMSPPTAVRPEMALVTDIRGECSAGFTPHTTWYPATPARPKMASVDVNLGSGAMAPTAMMDARPADRYSARWRVGLYRSVTGSGAGGLALRAGGAGRLMLPGGGGHMSSLRCVMMEPRTTSSLRSYTRLPSLSIMEKRYFWMLLANRVEAMLGRRVASAR
mmetsp:Transcript_17243/g.43954  ORF Transcript_17243/g.43954 Transcript_17243/m.43954 type:complete len:200 (-) Transcript_17243:1212-1811(-)